jgi:microsomal dipeptidase-like Zn-dependent dipeptidase
MHLLAGDADAVGLMTHAGRKSLADRFRGIVLRLANKIANYPGRGDKPAVTVPTLADSNVRVALSVLYAPFDEIDLAEHYGAPPRPRYFEDLLNQIAMVEEEVAAQSRLAVVAHTYTDLQAAQAGGKVALIHAIEGGFHIGDTEEAVRQNVQTLKARGVAYITVAHLFWRRVATNAPAIPFLPDALYALLFPQPRSGLTPLGEALITAMVESHILIDVTHMSGASIDATLRLLDSLDPKGTVPLVATHSACQAFGGRKYNLSDEHIAAIAKRGGLVGLIACRHWMSKGMPEPKTFADTMDVICKHMDHIRTVVGDPEGVHRFTAFGSDQDGFIKPALPGLDTPAGFVQVEEELRRRYGPTEAANICSGNALRVLQYW